MYLFLSILYAFISLIQKVMWHVLKFEIILYMPINLRKEVKKKNTLEKACFN